MSGPWADMQTDVVNIWEDVKGRLSVPFLHLNVPNVNIIHKTISKWHCLFYPAEAMAVSTPLTSRLLKVFQWHTLNVSSDKWCNVLLDHWCRFSGALGFIKVSTQHFFPSSLTEQHHLHPHKVMWSHSQVLTNWQKQIATRVLQTGPVSYTLPRDFSPSVSRGIGTPGRHFTNQHQPQAKVEAPKGLEESLQVRPRALDLPHCSALPETRLIKHRWIYTSHEQNRLNTTSAQAASLWTQAFILHMLCLLLIFKYIGVTLTEAIVSLVSLRGKSSSNSTWPYFYTRDTKGR